MDFALLISGFGVRVPGGAPPLTSTDGWKKIIFEDLCPQASEASDRHPPAGGTYRIRVSAGYDPVTGRRLMLSDSAETEDAAVLVCDRLRE